MGQKTSIYLTDELAARVKTSGLTLSELIRRGLDTTDLDTTVRTAVREELATILAPGASIPATSAG